MLVLYVFWCLVSKGFLETKRKVKFNGSIRMSRLCVHTLYTEHLSNGWSSRDLMESTHLEVGFLLRCFQQLSAPHMATQRFLLEQELADPRCVLPGPLVLGKTPLNALTLTPDMDRTVSRRSEPSSRTAFMGEQPNPWDVLPPQVAMSRHRGAKPSRRCGLLGKISLLSLE